MITVEHKESILNKMIQELELPDYAYDKARKRYEDIGDWFGRDDSILKDNDPHVFPQGSFRLGTAIRPINDAEDYDLDLACKLRKDISKKTHTQEQLKILVGQELEAYKVARGIKNSLEAKHRCWRLEYQDSLNFHMDIVPCIPADEERRRNVFESMRSSGLDELVANSASETTVAITDDRHNDYDSLSLKWDISNPEGYAEWFEYRMNPRHTRMLLEKAQVDDVPLFKRKSILQRCVQLLKRHRDNWSNNNPDSKPISIIITTLAARAYNGETNIVLALENILNSMGNLVNSTKPKVPNPVDPIEDFADKWYRADSLYLRLEDNFFAWLLQAQIDFKHLTSTDDAVFLSEQMEDKFSLKVGSYELKKSLGISTASVSIITPQTHKIQRRETAKPWRR